MAIAIDVRADIKGATRHLNRVQRKAIPTATVRALNKTATVHRKIGLQQVAKDIRLPQKNVTARFDKNGKKKGERATILKANKFNLESNIVIYSRGIPVIQVVSRAKKRNAAIKRLKGGIQAAGGRRYRRAFLEEAPGGNVQIFVRIGDGRYPLGVPKIGVRSRIEKAYDKAMEKTGRKVFVKEFSRLIARSIQRSKGTP